MTRFKITVRNRMMFAQGMFHSGIVDFFAELPDCIILDVDETWNVEENGTNKISVVHADGRRHEISRGYFWGAYGSYCFRISEVLE